MKKVDEKALRVKYLRNLQKFANSAINYLKKAEFSEAEFSEKMAKNMKFFKEKETISLNSTYAKKLEEFVNACINFTNKAELLSLANALDRQKKLSKKKQKHKNKFEEY